MKKIQQTVFFTIIFLFTMPEALSLCGNDLFCYICPYDTYDTNYENMLQISFNLFQELASDSCLPKDNTTIPQKNILIMNSPFCPECQTYPFNATYNSIGQAFVEESKLSLKFLYSELNFYLQNGDHYFNRDDFPSIRTEFFRRILVDITIQSFSGSQVNIYMKTNKFFIFVSKKIKFENISFFGYDLILNDDDDACLLLKNQTCCSEAQLNQTYNENVTCSIKGKQTCDNGIETDYGFFNIEYVFDNPNPDITPNFILKNCMFNNFYLLNNTEGFGTIVMMTSFSGRIEINNVTVKNSYFIQGFVYYLMTNYDLYAIISNNLITNESFKNNINQLNEIVIINNSQITNFNPLFNYNPNFLDNFVTLELWKGTLIIENTTFDYFFHIPSIFLFSNDDVQGEVNLINLNFSNLWMTPLILAEFITSLDFFFVEISNLINNSSEIISAKSIPTILIGFLKINNITTGDANVPIIFMNCNVEINNSSFLDNNVQAIITQIYNNLTINNCTFQNINFIDAILLFSLGQIFTISESYFQNLTSEMALFYVSSSQTVLVQTVSVTGSSIYSVFFLNTITQNLVYELYMADNILTILWSSDQTCDTTSFSQSFLTRNIFDNLFIDFNIPNVILNFDQIYLHYNNFTSTAILRIYFGISYLNKMNCICNFFTNSEIFLMVLNFSQDAVVYLNNSYFENNGITSTKRNHYVGSTDNCFISMGLGVKLTIYDNLTLIASDQIELGSGFFSGDTHGGLFQVGNSRLIFLSSNPNFDYKGMYMGDFVIAKIFNNSFYNLLCNNLTILHKHGSVFLGASSSYIYSQNSRSLYFHNNSFVNCSCNYYAGGFASIGMEIVDIQNCSFKNSSATNFAGHLLLIATDLSYLKNIIFESSLANEGSGAYFFNINNLAMINVSISNAVSRKNGVIYCRQINFLTMISLISANTSTLYNGGFLFIMNGFGKIENIIIYNSSAFLCGGSIYFDGSSSLDINNLEINYSQASTGGSLNIENSVKVTISNCSIIRSFSQVKGAAIFVNSINRLEMRNILIQENINTNGTGVILIQTDDESAIMFLTDIICIHNLAVMGACIYYFSSTPLILDTIWIENCLDYAIYTSWSFEIPLTISNLIIKNINSNVDIVSINFGEIYLVGWEIYNNNISQSLLGFIEVTGHIFQFSAIQNQANKVFEFLSCDILLSNFIVSNQADYSQMIGFCAGIQTNLVLTNGIISNNYDQGLSIANLQEGDCVLQNVTFSEIIGQVLVVEMTNLVIRNCVFKNNTSSINTMSNDITFTNPETFPYNFTIIDSYFEVYTHFSLDFEGVINITILNTHFFNLNLSENSNIFAINAFNFYCFILSSSIFSGFTDSSIKLQNDYNNLPSKSQINVNVFNSSFIKNKARIGSSFYISGTFELYFNKCTFSNNSAYMSNQSFLGGMAPAIFFKPINTSLSKIKIFSSNFIDNVAEYLAPTVFSQMEISVDRFNTYQNNEYLAEYNFTKKLFSFPIYVKPVFYERSDLTDKIFLNASNPEIIIVSGQSFNLTMQLVDYFGNVLTFDNSTVVMIKSQQGILLENNLMITNEGNISFQNLIIKANSNTTCLLSFEATLQKFNKDLGLELNTIAIKDEFNFTTRNCLQGEIIQDDASCFKCTESTYSLIDPMSSVAQFQRCLPCPDNIYCLGGCFITPEPGYYRKSNISTNVVPCINPDACLGYVQNTNASDPSLIHGACSEGSFGPVCFYCETIYGKYQNTDVCSYCELIKALIYARLVLTVLFVLLNIMISVANLEKFSKKDSEKDIFSILSKIIINHSQHIMLIIGNSLSLPDFSFFKNFFNIFDYFSFINVGSFMNECFLNSFYYNPQKLVIYISLYASFIPFTLAFASLLFWLCVAVISRHMFISHLFDQELRTFHRRFVFKYMVYLLITAYMFYPMILKASFTLMDCFKLDANDTTVYLRESPDLECWNSDHIKYICLYALPGLLIWGIAFPFFLFVLLKINRKSIVKTKKQNVSQGSSLSPDLKKKEKKKEHKKSVFGKMIENFNPISNKMSVLTTEKKNEQQKTVRKKGSVASEEIRNKNLVILSYFYCGYRSTYYYWESIIFIRKFLLTLILTLDQKINEEYKWTLVVIILFLAFSMTFQCKPYKTKFLNKLELLSLVICVLSCFISFLSVSDENKIFKNIFNVICIVFNVTFYGIAVILIFYDFLEKIKGKTNRLKEFVIGSFQKGKGKFFHNTQKIAQKIFTAGKTKKMANHLQMNTIYPPQLSPLEI